MEEVMWRMMASVIKARLKKIERMEEDLGESDYLKGKKDGTLLVLSSVADYLHAEGIVDAKQFISAIIEPAKKELELSTASCE